MIDIRTALEGERTECNEHRGDVARHLLSSAEVARFCGVPREEVLGWIDSGRLEASYLPVDRYRIDVGDLIAFLHKYELEI
jgi:hypothetical protein